MSGVDSPQQLAATIRRVLEECVEPPNHLAVAPEADEAITALAELVGAAERAHQLEAALKAKAEESCLFEDDIECRVEWPKGTDSESQWCASCFARDVLEEPR